MFNFCILTKWKLSSEGVRSRAWFPNPGSILCRDPELILSTIREIRDGEGQLSDLISVAFHPTTPRDITSFNDVASDRRATVVFRWGPGYCDGSLVDVLAGWLSGRSWHVYRDKAQRTQSK